MDVRGWGKKRISGEEKEGSSISEGWKTEENTCIEMI